MAKNLDKRDGHLDGPVKGRSQVQGPTGWIKRNRENGQFMDVKQDGKPFKGVSKER